ncbi:helix-turn-helix domain-containing protein [Cohnella fermenti]|nr:helix-turn-helix domain-containing protein [Cohnella fermenti]
MRENGQPPAIGSLLFQLLEAVEVRGAGYGMFEESVTEAHLLLLFSGGEGALQVGDRYYSVGGGQIFWLPPGTEYMVDRGAERPADYYRLEFLVVRSERDRLEPYRGTLAEEAGPLRTYPHSQLVQLAGRIAKKGAGNDGLADFRRNMLFQELIGYLLDESLRLTLRESLRYIDSHYAEALSVKELADRAGIPYWQYASAFKELTGQKPNDYIADLRIERAKELLLHTDEPLREIARQTGFVDEYYLSRKFRQATGQAPRRFAVAMSRGASVSDWRGHEVRVPEKPRRIVYYGETLGDLLILGVRPVGADVGDLGEAWYIDELGPIADIGRPPDPKAVAELKPDLIIFSNADERRYGDLARIAPTVAFDSFGSVPERVETLGRLLGLESEAAAWLERHRRRTDEMWNKLQGKLEEGETATVFVYHRGKRLFVMGTIGLAEALYHPLGFRPPERVRPLLEQRRAYKEIAEDAAQDYAGDRVFLILPHNPDSREQTEALLRSERWAALKAVREGRAHAVEEAKWNFGDAFTREKLLDLLPALLGPGTRSNS